MTGTGAGGEPECGSPGFGLRMEPADWDRKGRKRLAEHQGCGWRDVHYSNKLLQQITCPHTAWWQVVDLVLHFHK